MIPRGHRSPASDSSIGLVLPETYRVFRTLSKALPRNRRGRILRGALSSTRVSGSSGQRGVRNAAARLYG